MDLASKIKSLPLSSGVYLMKDEKGEVIYIGKAVSLRRRVQSYFRSSQQSCPKTEVLISYVKDIDYIITSSEAEALILEASLVKKYNPKFNIDLKDDKSYPFIEITGDEFPQVSVVRPRKRNEKSLYYGPYVNAKLLREALSIIRRIFPFRRCDRLPKKECLDYHMGLCDGPCVGKISREDYADIIRNIRLILEGRKDSLYHRLRHQMEVLSQQKRFEEAARIRDQIHALSALYSGTKDINYYKEAEQLKRLLNLSRMPERIEAFDISNILGIYAVGGMVSFLNGKPDKKNYRRFRIKLVEGIDDFAMISEVVSRRYRRLRDEGLAFPDLILIDGGKGQLSAALQSLRELDINTIPLIALAKKEESIFIPGKRDPILLSRDSLGLKLLQRIRDEAHRFAVAYHRKLRDKGMFL